MSTRSDRPTSERRTRDLRALTKESIREHLPASIRLNFLERLRSPDWKIALTLPAFAAYYRNSAAVRSFYRSVDEAAQAIAADDEKVQRVLELAGIARADPLLLAVARLKGRGFVEGALSHYRSAKGTRRIALQQALDAADPLWPRDKNATLPIRQGLRQHTDCRANLITALHRADMLPRFLATLRDHPPQSSDEWSALGRSAQHDQVFVDLALATMATLPGTLGYLLRLDPSPPLTQERMLACAENPWLARALELALHSPLFNPELIPLAEIALTNGRHSRTLALSWIGNASLHIPLSVRLAGYKRQNLTKSHLICNSARSAHRSASSARAIHADRQGHVPDSADVAALIRGLSPRSAEDFVKEIITNQRDHMMSGALRHLCAINPSAAAQTVRMARSQDPDTAARAQELMRYRDVLWPDEQDIARAAQRHTTPTGGLSTS